MPEALNLPKLRCSSYPKCAERLSQQQYVSRQCQLLDLGLSMVEAKAHGLRCRRCLLKFIQSRRETR
jgi:hypothetical protein